ncbi:MAG: EF-P 5-aminopentanol modification-associated protein YfmH [Planctomycetota bacterium]|jgi:predicted Zn-dependent peptidase
MTWERIANPLDEPILQTRLPSGLRVMLNPRPRYHRTFAAFGTNFGSVDRVGGPAGEPVPPGLAHFLEHKLFEDEAGDVSDRFAALGASTNAMTGFCGTTYIMSTVEGQAAGLDLLLDFVQDPWFTDELVQKEQGIIAQEIRMYDDDPDWRLFFGLLGCMYARHPVRDNIAGSVESIAEIDAATLEHCYGLFYHPSNMCLSISGALDPAEVLERVTADQEARGIDELAPHERREVDEPVGVVQARYDTRLPVARPRVMLGIKERELGGDGGEVLRRELATRILLDILFGQSSVAHEQLYTEGLVDETFGVSYSSDSSFGFTTIGGDTDQPEVLEERVRAVLRKARQDGLDAAAFERIRHKVYGSQLRGMDMPENVAFAMISDTFRGVAPLRAFDVIQELGMDDLMKRLEAHVHDDAITVAVVRPLGES